MGHIFQCTDITIHTVTLFWIRNLGLCSVSASGLTVQCEVTKMDNITASEIAGLGVGVLLLSATIAAPKIDSFISASQRSSLGMCKKCGDLRIIACTTCRGSGSVKVGFNIIDGFYESVFGVDDSDAKTTRCTKCRAKGHFRCPNCSATR